MPKSAILMLFFSSNNKFSGFKSLWLEDESAEREVEACHQLVVGFWTEHGLSFSLALTVFQIRAEQLI